MKRVLLKVAAVLSFVATCGLIVFGQGSSTGSLSGAVTDPNKDVVANATVTVKNDATGEEFTSATADNGTFNVPALAVGVYTATISATGFKQVVATDIKVDVGKASNINVALEVGAPTEQVTIVGGTLFFTATTAHTGSELWKSDGTTEGTVPVRDISPAPVADSNVLTVGEIRVDPPTLHALGVQVLIGGDENRNGRITVRYRQVGSTDWRAGLPLMRVFPETVTVSVPHQFAGSVFDLAPATSYEIELHAVDPDGGVDVLRMVRATTRPVPRTNPSAPRVVQVTDASTLRTALSGARPGDVITLANGRYVGTFALSASGTEAQPIVIRGASTSGVVLDGSNCTGCNILEVYGSFVHVERLMIAHAIRGLRFLGVNATGNVARRLVIQNVVHGIGSSTGQSNFYIADNDIDGRLQWPWVFASDATNHWDDRGVEVTGDGHVVCHNKIRGFGDPVVNKQRRARSWDVYGNDIA
ncbi:MAG: carboxypeptidase regulatory-like domain-containing protein, partial [Pyrinomonadaceae bacterium]|nr:carboxypeptidase regulatory-like domain-containing protein [Pyrinomonadaceae bacterium]